MNCSLLVPNLADVHRFKNDQLFGCLGELRLYSQFVNEVFDQQTMNTISSHNNDNLWCCRHDKAIALVCLIHSNSAK